MHLSIYYKCLCPSGCSSIKPKNSVMRRKFISALLFSSNYNNHTTTTLTLHISFAFQQRCGKFKNKVQIGHFSFYNMHLKKKMVTFLFLYNSGIVQKTILWGCKYEPLKPPLTTQSAIGIFKSTCFYCIACSSGAMKCGSHEPKITKTHE